MDAALAQSTAPSRGARLLLDHCAILDADERRIEPQQRLSDLLGSDLAGLLVRALAGGRGASRYRDVA